MKKMWLPPLSLLTIFLFFTSSCFAQNFEGHVTYNEFGETKDSSIKFMEVYFKKDMLRINFIKDSNDTGGFSEYIYDFKKGISYEISPEKKIIVTHLLKNDPLYVSYTYDSLPGATKNILGHNCVRYLIVNNMFRDSGMPGLKAWFPVDIPFYVPGALHFLSPGMFFNGTTFSFEVEIIRNIEEVEEGDKIKDTISTRAVLIETKSIEDSIFRLNKGFTIKTWDQYQKERMSSKFTPPKIVADEPKNSMKKTAPKSTKKRAPAKSAAVRRKE